MSLDQPNPSFTGGAVGQSVPKVDSLEKVQGRAEYIADLYRPGMLHGAILASPYPHARIRGYDLTEALAAPGVVAIITGDDVGEGRMGAFIKDEHAIAKGKVLYVGEPVAAVAARTEAEARAACRLIRVDYEELPAILSPEEGLEEGAAILHEKLADYIKVFDAGSQANLCSRTELSEGNVEGAWAGCDVIVEGEYTTQPQAHVSMEPCGALAEVDANGRVTLWSANQSVFRVQANVCESLSLPMSKLRSLTPRVGAGFGNKMEPHIQPITVALALDHLTDAGFGDALLRLIQHVMAMFQGQLGAFAVQLCQILEELFTTAQTNIACQIRLCRVTLFIKDVQQHHGGFHAVSYTHLTLPTKA